MVLSRLGNCSITSARKPNCPRALPVPVLKQIEAFAAQVAQFTIVASKTVQRLPVLGPQLHFETGPKRRRFVRRNTASLIFRHRQRRLPEDLIIEPFKRSRSSTRSQLRPLPYLARTTHEDPDCLWGLVVQVDTAEVR